jgi:hypothetical protein
VAASKAFRRPGGTGGDSRFSSREPNDSGGVELLGLSL